VAAAGVMAGGRLTGTPLSRQRVVILGAGAAGIGIARLMRDTLRRAGLDGADLARAIASLDTRGLVVDDAPIADEHKRPFAWPAALAEEMGLGAGKPRDLLAVVRAVRPTVLIGTSGEPHTFTEEVVRAVAREVERPLVFPMSNPTSKSEATPSDVIAWSGGRALVATGSPFAPVSWQGRTIAIGQGNNAFVFPGVGLGVLVSGAREVTESMFAAAAERLADEVGPAELAAGSLFPAVRDIRRVSARVAAAVVREARERGLGRALSDEEIPRAVAEAMWEPAYAPLEPAPVGRDELRPAAAEPAGLRAG
jgi:malic enzyme